MSNIVRRFGRTFVTKWLLNQVPDDSREIIFGIVWYFFSYF